MSVLDRAAEIVRGTGHAGIAVDCDGVRVRVGELRERVGAIRYAVGFARSALDETL